MLFRSMVRPKAATVTRILDTAPEEVQIVIREPVGFGRLWNESAEWGLDPRLEVAGYGPAGRTLSRNLFVRRRPDAA